MQKKERKLPKIMGVQEVFDYLGFWTSKGAIYVLLKRDLFPKPVQYVKAGPLWVLPQIEEYKKQHETRESPYTRIRREGGMDQLKETFRESIEACIKAVGHVPTTYEYRSWAKENQAPTYNTISRHLFESGVSQANTWEAALNVYGYTLEGKPSQVAPEFTYEECIEAVKECYTALKIAFSMRQYDAWARKRNKPTARQIIRMVGNFNAAKDIANVPKLKSIKDIYD